MKKMKTVCAILAFFVFSILVSPATVHAANTSDMVNYDAEAKEIFQELTDAFVGLDWIEEEMNTYFYPDSVIYNRPENYCDIAARVSFDELSSVDIIIYYWTYYHYQTVVINIYESPLLPSIKELLGNREEFFDYFRFMSYSDYINSSSKNYDKSLEEAFSKVCAFQYDYMLAHDNQPYDFTVFIQNDSIKVSDEPGIQEPDPSGSQEKESEEPSKDQPSQSLEQSQESPSIEAVKKDAERSPWEDVMDKIAGSMLSILILVVTGTALLIIKWKKGKSSRKGD